MTITSKHTADGLIALERSALGEYYLTIDGERAAGPLGDAMASEIEARDAFWELREQIEHDARMRG